MEIAYASSNTCHHHRRRRRRHHIKMSFCVMSVGQWRTDVQTHIPKMQLMNTHFIGCNQEINCCDCGRRLKRRTGIWQRKQQTGSLKTKTQSTTTATATAAFGYWMVVRVYDTIDDYYHDVLAQHRRRITHFFLVFFIFGCCRCGQ